jgi:hypothetical protein
MFRCDSNDCGKTAYNDHLRNQNLAQTGNLNTVCGDGNAGAQYNLEATLPREGILLA